MISENPLMIIYASTNGQVVAWVPVVWIPGILENEMAKGHLHSNPKPPTQTAN